MKHIYRIVAILAASLLVFAAAAYQPLAEGESSIALWLALGTAVFTAAVLYLDLIFQKLDGERLLLIALGVFVGLAAAHLVQPILAALGLTGAGVVAAIHVMAAVFFGFAGARFAKSPGLRIFSGGPGGMAGAEMGSEGGPGKLLDTSVIIDGRILDIAETKFVEGPFIIPNFVLREIQLISDSPDPIKRNRGRRGLEMLNKLQQRTDIVVKISYLDYSDIREVDAKLIRASRELGTQLVTNDFNLNKVAELQGVEVLNLNTLTNALKPVVLPGEDILIDIIKEGKDENQGIGYLEDGTMVVVENGGQMVGKTVKVNVTSIIQTAAGKMIFTRAQGVVEDNDHGDDRGRGGQGGGRGRGDNRGRNDNRRHDGQPHQHREGGEDREAAGQGGGGGSRRERGRR
jgi:uncharacterized protein YacL